MQSKGTKKLTTSGFTLIELMVTVSIAGIVMSIAVPSFISTIRSNQLTSAANQFVTTLNFARSEAIKRGYRVIVEKATTAPTGVWENGWRVYIDYNANNAFNDDGDALPCEAAIGTATPEDCFLREFGPLPSAYTLRTNSVSQNYIAYYPTGMNNVLSSFMLCDDSDNNQTPEAYTAKLITINRVGRLRIGQDTDGNGIPNTDASGNPNVTSCTSPFTP